MIPQVIRRDHVREQRARVVAYLLLAAGLIACALWPRSLAWAFLGVPLFALLVSAWSARRDVPRLEIYPDRLVLKQAVLEDVIVPRRDVAVFTLLHMKHGDAVVAFAEPPPLQLRSAVPRSSDTVLPTGLEMPLDELQSLLAKWLVADS